VNRRSRTSDSPTWPRSPSTRAHALVEVQVGRFEAVAHVGGSAFVGHVERRVDQHRQVRQASTDGQFGGGLEAREVDAAA